jgi:hypothetical protein
MQKSSKFLLEIMTLVSLANIMGIDEVFSVGGRSFIQIRKSKGPKIYPWGTPCFLVPQFEYVVWVKFDDFISIVCFFICYIRSEPTCCCSLNSKPKRNLVNKIS